MNYTTRLFLGALAIMCFVGMPFGATNTVKAQGVVQIIDATGDGMGNMLTSPRYVATDTSGNVFVSGAVTDNVFKIAPNGVISQIIDATGDGMGITLDSPAGLAADDMGNVYVAGGGTNNVFKITPGGVITQIIDSTGDGMGNMLNGPLLIAVDANKNVFVFATTDTKIFKITPGGVITQIMDSTGDGMGNAFDSADQMVVDSSGNLFVPGATGGNAFKITPSGVISEITGANGGDLGHTTGIAVDPDGNVYVANFMSSNSIIKITPSGVITTIFSITFDGMGMPLFLPDFLVVDSAGNVFAADFSSTVSKINSDGTSTVILDATGDGMGNVFSGTGGTSGIALDKFGNLFVTGASSNNAFEVQDVAVIPAVPTVSEWGLVVLALFTVTFGTLLIARKRKYATCSQSL